MLRKYLIFLLSASLTAVGVTSSHAAGVGAGGRDVLHVPMSWCVVRGSPAEANPNITSEGGVTDTETDALIWRRHERPTDNIFLPQADITLRSAINNSWTTLDFPIIDDPDTSLGLEGDVRGEDNSVLGDGSEYDTVLTDCETAYNDIGRAGLGITAVNINLFHDSVGDYFQLDMAGDLMFSTPIGWGGCTKFVGDTTCAEPYEGTIMVIDNNYLYPTVADRTLPVTPLNPAGTLQYSVTDPLDQLVGHEVGHALGLPHQDVGSTNLMFPTTTDNSGDGRVDNTFLSTAEADDIRTSSAIVPGLEIDPPAQINPGNYVAMAVTDSTEESHQLPRHLDIGSLKLSLNKASGQVYVSTRLRGITPMKLNQPGELFVAFDLDPQEKFDQKVAIANNLPLEKLNLDGADVVFFVQIFSGGGVEMQGWSASEGQFKEISTARASFKRLTVHPYFAPVTGQKNFTIPVSRGLDIRDIVTIEFPAKQFGLAMNTEIEVAAVTTFKREKFDRLETNKKIILENPSFPHCFAETVGLPGGNAVVRVENLLPGKNIHALFGPDEVFKGVTDDDGNLKFELPIPEKATNGLHLVTVGIDDTALTADCVVKVNADGKDIPIPARKATLSDEIMDELRRQNKAIEQLREALNLKK